MNTSHSSYMNWHFLKEECSTSLSMYINWIAHHKKKSVTSNYIDRQDKLIIEWCDSKEKFTVVDYRLRDLYDFFDEKEIRIAITHDLNNNFTFEISTPSEAIKKLIVSINNSNSDSGFIYKSRTLFNSRVEAEITSFRQAFILLENDTNTLRKEWRDKKIDDLTK